jgi:hypothetical protein
MVQRSNVSLTLGTGLMERWRSSDHSGLDKPQTALITPQKNGSGLWRRRLVGIAINSAKSFAGIVFKKNYGDFKNFNPTQKNQPGRVYFLCFESLAQPIGALADADLRDFHYLIT